MNNKKTGMQFEKEFLKYLADNGWWVHFLTPNLRGQPFDVIAIRGSITYMIDCKTCATDRFQFSRIEDNQALSFEQAVWKTQAQCGFAILYNDELYFLPYEDVMVEKKKGNVSIKLTEAMKQGACNRFE